MTLEDLLEELIGNFEDESADTSAPKSSVAVVALTGTATRSG